MAIVDDRSVSDELVAAQVRDAAAVLNTALAAASRAGLRTDVSVEGVYAIGDPETTHCVHVHVSRPL